MIDSIWLLVLSTRTYNYCFETGLTGSFRGIWTHNLWVCVSPTTRTSGLGVGGPKHQHQLIFKYSALMHSGRSQGGQWGPSPITSGLCPITRPWAPSAFLTPSPNIIHDLGVFNIYICAICNKITQITRICSTSRDFAQNRDVYSLRFFP